MFAKVVCWCKDECCEVDEYASHELGYTIFDCDECRCHSHWYDDMEPWWDK